MPSRRLGLAAVFVTFVLPLVYAGCSSDEPPPIGAGDDAQAGGDATTDATTDATSGGDATTGSCGTCAQGMVCCAAPLGCAGQCVPDCRLGGSCPNGLSCDQSTGVCSPGGGDAGPMPEGGPLPDGGPPPPDGGKLDGGMLDGGKLDGGKLDGGKLDAGTLDGGTDGGTVSVGEGEVSGGGNFATYLANNAAISGTTVALGATSSNCQNGKTFVYVWDGQQWNLQQTLTGTANTLECFGSSETIYGDTIIVGAPQKNTGTGTGAAFVETRSGTTWTQAQEIDGPIQTDSWFGWASSFDGTTLAIGAPLETGVGPHSYSGGVHILTKKAQFTQQTYFNAPVITDDTCFGESVAIDGGTLVVGAPGQWELGFINTTPGSVYVYTGSGSSWTNQASLQPNDVTYNDAFGWSVAFSGTTLIAGAPYNDTTATDAGAAYVYTYNGSTWSQQAKLLANNGVAGDELGFSVAAIAEDHVLVGAAGAKVVYSFTRSGTTWTQDTSYTGCTNSQLGWNLNHDGTNVVSGKSSEWIIDLNLTNTTCVGP